MLPVQRLNTGFASAEPGLPNTPLLRTAFNWSEPAAAPRSPVLVACDPRLPATVIPSREGDAALVRNSLFPDTPEVHAALDEGQLPSLDSLSLRARADAIGVREVLLDLPAATHALRSKLFAICRDAGLRLVVPRDSAVAPATTPISAPMANRPVNIEDLLARPGSGIDEQRVAKLIAGNTVLVTGAGGSIGSVLCEEIARFNPATLILLDQSEYSLYRVDEQFARKLPDVRRICLVGDVRQRGRMEQLLARYRPEVVFHAAAYKHVPLLEADNAWEALRNNVVGTEVIARAAMHAGVDRFVLISTDKAVNPVSVMGASKRMAEMVCQALQQQTARPCFEIVRFGNVIGSAGSVIPLFEEQIRRGDLLTVTHREMRRYFMSIKEASRLLLQAATMGQGGEIFVMDMGEPIRVVDVARDMLRMAGVSRPDERIEFVGLRPGERLFEELLAPGECTRTSEHPGLHIARARSVEGNWLNSVMQVLAEDREPEDWRSRLGEWVPEFRPQG